MPSVVRPFRSPKIAPACETIPFRLQYVWFRTAKGMVLWGKTYGIVLLGYTSFESVLVPMSCGAGWLGWAKREYALDFAI